jgi:sec-independent protein translocase protein TatC
VEMDFKFLFNFGGDIDTPMITIDHYLSFFS